MGNALRRRRFQFGVLGLLLVVAVVMAPLAWVGAQMRLRDSRNAAINYFHPTGHFSAGPRPRRTFGQWLVGGVQVAPVMTVQVSSDADEGRLDALRRLFPECEIRVKRIP